MVGLSLQNQLGMHDIEEKIARDRKAAMEAARHSMVREELETENENFDREQVEAACRNDLNFLAAMAMPEEFSIMFSPTHTTMWQIMLGMEEDLETQFPQLALGIPRGHAKTTLIKLCLLWMILFSKRRFILITAATEQHAINILGDVWDMLCAPNIAGVFGNAELGLETDMKMLKKFGFRGRNIVLAAIGAQGSVRGLNIKNTRPDVIVMDDIQTKDCADSQVQSTALEEWMVGTLMKAKDQRRCFFIFAGNIFPTPYSILKKLKSNPTWTKFVSGAILADGTALWPEYRSLDSLVEELNNDISMGQAHIFFAEVMNDTTVGINTSVDYSKFPEWPWADTDLPEGKFLVIDPSQGKGMDADVIVLAEVHDERAGVRQIWEGYYSPLTLIKKALLVALENEVYCIAVESMAYQATLLFWFDHVCKEIGVSGITFVPIYTNTMAKNARIVAAIKAMQTKELYLHPDVKSAVTNQIADWNPMKRDNKDDILDAISNINKVRTEYTYDIMAKGNLLQQEVLSSGVVEDNFMF